MRFQLENKDYEQKRTALMNKYPDILKPHGWPGVGDGWLPIVDELCANLMTLPSPPKAVQIKEKFGGLRFYTDKGDNKITEYILQAEDKAERTCEYCGKPGKLVNTGWWKTLCDEHAGT